jgi:hypothetical protein
MKHGVIIEHDGETTVIETAADVADVGGGRLMIATVDGEQQIIDGGITGAYGRWKMWHEQNGVINQYDAERPITVPPEIVSFRYRYEQDWLKTQLGGKIKRLKKLEL